MYKRLEGRFTGYQDMRLFYQSWQVEKPRGVLVITHGQSEHSECYQRVVDALAPLSLNSFAWDWRGHGRSEGQRGFVANFNDYCHDFERFMTEVRAKQDSSLPLFLLAHSMGAPIQLKSILLHPEWQIKAQVLSAPMMGVAVEVPKIKDLAARLLVNLMPKITLSNELTNDMVTRDPEVVKEIERDPLRHNRISSAVYLGSLEAIDFIMARAEKIQVPTLIQMPENDRVVSSPAAIALYHKLKCSKELKVYKDREHEIYNDLGREEVFSDLGRYLQSSL